VFADSTPSSPGDEPAAPGEDAAGSGDDTAALARMVDALRSLEGSPALVRDAGLDAMAREHAERMRDTHLLAHDVGDGDLLTRLGTTRFDARVVGENVAHAKTVALAHRALHASPSHRMNLLRADYTHFGVATTRAADGSVYVCETFAAVPKAL
jgi:uncharacterized protein YkwD